MPNPGWRFHQSFGVGKEDWVFQWVKRSLRLVDKIIGHSDSPSSDGTWCTCSCLKNKTIKILDYKMMVSVPEKNYNLLAWLSITGMSAMV
jgi:hypothetical protein